MASTYDRLLEQFREERRRGADHASVGGRAAGNAPPSPLLRRLTAELSYTPPGPGQFARELTLRLGRIADEFERDRAAHERDAAVLKEYQAVEGELEAEFAGLTPYGVNPEKAVVRAARVMVELAAARHLISLIPAHVEESGVTDKAEAVDAARAEAVSRLVAWRDRLREERLRLRDEINALPPGEAASLLGASPFNVSPLRQGLAAVVAALEEADGNQSGYL